MTTSDTTGQDGVEQDGVEPGSVEPGSVEPDGVEPDGVEPGTAASVVARPADEAAVLDHPAVRRVVTALHQAGAGGRVVVLGEHARTAVAAAEQLGVTVGQIANSLVFAVTDPEATDGRRPLLVLTSGAHRVDTAKVAATIGVPTLHRADADFVRERTGFVIGGVAPLGHLAAVQTLVDVDLAGHDEVWAAAGHARTVFATTYDELVRVTGGTPTEVA